ncbi:MAG: hypothetical protein WC979_06395 [Candidatus Pacearchaeota archaeon]|jgi:hypothetical protein
MVNEDILTSIKNAVEHGDSLQAAINTAIASGYNPKEVQEAAQLVGQGTLSALQTKPEEHLVMPNKKSFFSRTPKTTPVQPVTQPVSQTQPVQQRPVQIQSIPAKTNSLPEDYSQIKREIYPSQNTYSAPMTSQNNSSQNKTLSQEIKELSPKRPSYIKEIVLGLILFMLLSLLGITILLKDQLLDFFSKLG